MRVLCFDIGGTAIKYALIENDNLKDININKMPTRKEKDKNYILIDVLNVIESYDNSNNFLSNDHTVFHSVCTNLHAHQQCMRDLVSPYSCQHLSFLILFVLAILTGVR